MAFGKNRLNRYYINSNDNREPRQRRPEQTRRWSRHRLGGPVLSELEQKEQPASEQQSDAGDPAHDARHQERASHATSPTSSSFPAAVSSSSPPRVVARIRRGGERRRRRRRGRVGRGRQWRRGGPEEGRRLRGRLRSGRRRILVLQPVIGGPQFSGFRWSEIGGEENAQKSKKGGYSSGGRHLSLSLSLKNYTWSLGV
ncbi:uncharacterized protein J3R85_005157 [Psidium guajava]|nr:uncharacterized protein J3R85_005157 [Psidium guajava]